MTPERKKQLKAEFAAREQHKVRDAIPMELENLKAFLKYLNREDAPACDHTLSESISWLKNHGEDPKKVVQWLRENGGFCDCEVICNVYDTVGDLIGWYLEE